MTENVTVKNRTASNGNDGRLPRTLEKSAFMLTVPFFGSIKAKQKQVRPNPAMRRKADYNYVRSHLNDYDTSRMPVTLEGRRALREAYAPPKPSNDPALAKYVDCFRKRLGDKTIPEAGEKGSRSENPVTSDYYYRLLTNPFFSQRLRSMGYGNQGVSTIMRNIRLHRYISLLSDTFGGFFSPKLQAIFIPKNVAGNRIYNHEMGHVLGNHLPRYMDIFYKMARKHGIRFGQYVGSATAPAESYWHHPLEQLAQFNAIRGEHPELMPGRGSGPNGTFVERDLTAVDPEAQKRYEQYKARKKELKTLMFSGQDRSIEESKRISDEYFNLQHVFQPKSLYDIFDSDPYFNGLPKAYILDLLNQARARRPANAFTQASGTKTASVASAARDFVSRAKKTRVVQDLSNKLPWAVGGATALMLLTRILTDRRREENDETKTASTRQSIRNRVEREPKR